MKSYLNLRGSEKKLFLEPEVVKYLKIIEKKEKKFTKEEERALIIEAKSGNIEARNKLVEAHLKFVVACAKEVHNGKTCLQDLINCGNIGLINAVNKFDLTKESKFISCAVWWIRFELQEYMFRNSLIHVPFNKTRELKKINQRIERAEAKGETANYEDVYLLATSKCLQTKAGVDGYVSIGTVLEEEEQRMMPKLELISTNCVDSTNIFERVDNLHKMNKLLTVLTPFEREVFSQKYGLFACGEKTDDILAEEFGVSNFVIKKTVNSSRKKIKNIIKREEFA